MSEQLNNMVAQGPIAHPVDGTGRVTLKKDEAAAMRRLFGIADGEAFELIATQEVLKRDPTDPPSAIKAFGCMLMFAPKQWETFEREVDALPMLDPVAAEMRRLYVGGKCKISVDKQDRMKLSSSILEWAGLTAERSHATLLFAGSWWELWETDAYDEHLRESAADIEAYRTRKWGDAAAAPDEDAER